MSDTNVVIISGRVGNLDELKSFDNGGSVLGFSLAQNYRAKEGEEWVEKTNWHRISVFGKRGEGLAKCLAKGQYVVVKGELRQVTKGEGDNKRTYTNIVAEDVSLGPKSNKQQTPVGNADDDDGFPPGPPGYADVD